MKITWDCARWFLRMALEQKSSQSRKIPNLPHHLDVCVICICAEFETVVN